MVPEIKDDHGGEIELGLGGPFPSSFYSDFVFGIGEKARPVCLPSWIVVLPGAVVLF